MWYEATVEMKPVSFPGWLWKGAKTFFRLAEYNGQPVVDVCTGRTARSMRIRLGLAQKTLKTVRDESGRPVPAKDQGLLERMFDENDWVIL